MNEKSIIEKLGIRPKEWEVVNYDFDSEEHLKKWLSQTVDNTVNNGDSINGYFVVLSGDSTEEDPIFTAITANGPTSEKHANLIASSPEMLEALIITTLGLELIQNYEGIQYKNNITVIEKACHPKTWEQIKELIK